MPLFVSDVFLEGFKDRYVLRMVELSSKSESILAVGSVLYDDNQGGPSFCGEVGLLLTLSSVKS